MITVIKAKLLLILTNVEKSQLIKTNIKKIIILRYDRVGDLIVSLPLISALKEIFPQAKTTVIASEVNAPIAKISNTIDRTVVKKQNVFLWILQLLALRKGGPDLVVDLNHSVAPHTIVAVRLLNAPHVASPYKDGRWGVKGNRLRLFDIMPKQDPQQYSRPISDLYLDIALTLGYLPERSNHYPLPGFGRPDHLKKSYIVLNPCGSRSTMRLRDTDLVAIADEAARLDPSLEIVVSTEAQNHERYTSLFSEKTNVSVASPSSTIIPTLALVQHSQLVITPDTALVHVACAYSVKLIAVYTNDQALFEQWKPLNKATTRIIRSTDPKGLKGYSSMKLLDHVKSMIINLNERPPTQT